VTGLNIQVRSSLGSFARRLLGSRKRGNPASVPHFWFSLIDTNVTLRSIDEFLRVGKATRSLPRTSEHYDVRRAADDISTVSRTVARDGDSLCESGDERATHKAMRNGVRA
jgi:hypothetical protein